MANQVCVDSIKMEELSFCSELHKLEYEKAAERYENIYKALWQNFNYMAILAAAVLTFGKDELGLMLSATASAAILLAWYWISFEPLNKYGDDAEDRLAAIETVLSAFVLSRCKEGCFLDENQLNLKHFTNFRDRRPKRGEGKTWWILPLAALAAATIGGLKNRTWEASAWAASIVLVAALTLCSATRLWTNFRRPSSVRYAVRFFALILHFSVVLLLWQLGSDWGPVRRSIAAGKTTRVVITQPITISPTK